MNKRTFEVIAKYISEEHGIKVVITPECNGPQMNIEKKTIWLPENIKEENALSALAALIHEAAHMRYTSEMPDGLAKNKDEHHVLNAMEDVRIDLYNFQKLPNIKEFYKLMYKEHTFTEERKERLKKAPLLIRILVSNILYQTGFSAFDCDDEAYGKGYEMGINSLFWSGVSALQYKNWDEAMVKIREILEIFKQGGNNGGANKQQKRSTSGGAGQSDDSGSGQGNTPDDCGGTEQAEEGLGGVPNQSDSAGNAGCDDGSHEGEGDDNQSSEGDCCSEDPEEYMRSGGMWGKGSGLSGKGGQGFTVQELRESTKRTFIDALTVKEKRIVSDGTVLDTDNLISFFTGEIKDLFIEDVIEKKRKSKIIFALDCSGSMGCNLNVGKTTRGGALVSAVKALTDILDEVRETEGLAVDYEVVSFDDTVHRLGREDWVKEYWKFSGGTYIWGAYDACKKILMEDPETDGSKMLVLVTDGEVGTHEIDDIKRDILQDNNDIRIMVIGVGADMCGSFVKRVIGDNNIIAEETAEEIIMGSIQTMLGD